METTARTNIVLILGASGFIGNTIYKELTSYFDVYGTYCTPNDFYKSNQVFYRYCVEEDTIETILEEIRPSFIISCIHGDFAAQFQLYKTLSKYIQQHHYSNLLYVSSASVFSARHHLPSYENDKPVSESVEGKFKASVEKILLTEIPAQTAVLRLPMVLGIHSPRIIQFREAIKHQAAFEVYPNVIISVTTAQKIAQQIHYILNKRLSGIFHLASSDMTHHEDLFREIASTMNTKMPIFKSVFTSNDDRYAAILSKINPLPDPYTITVSEVIEDSTLPEEITTFRN
ncbi:sugar nucleotide-binding protein [Cochleicola gelatinilyticus]|uniref:dTDP-4-dehydrorhamnose reductase n=1 Tax=Cochleicola gelatinilyticus TaxID=1763537 RepID=A0A167HUK1_9FLAO|nr:sugar nucleotide-binding protein [Cochleicola gelatinilyticus]OAB78978.1 hypothetical protein ULVI_10420 [Cochleicola gelatinilyticus]